MIPTSMDLYFQSVTICAVAALITTIQLLFNRQLFKRPSVLSFIFFSVNVTLWGVLELIHSFNFRHFGPFQRLYVFESLMLIPTAWLFLKRNLGLQINRKFLLHPIYGFWCLGLGATVSLPNTALYVIEDYVSILNFVFLIALGLVVYIKGKETQNRDYREHVSTISFGILLTAACFASNHFTARLPLSFSVGHIALAVLLYLNFYALSKRSLLTWEIVLLRVTHLLLMTAMMSSVYNLVTLSLGEQPEWIFFNTMVASLVLLVLFEPFNQLAQFIFNRVFSQHQSRKFKKIKHDSSSLSPIYKLEDLMEQSRSYLKEFFNIDSLGFYLANSSYTIFTQFSKPENPDNPPPFPHEISSHLLTDLPNFDRQEFIVDIRSLSAHLQIVDHRYERHVSKRWIEFLNKVHAQAFIPLMTADSYVGFILVRSPSALKCSRLLQSGFRSYFSEIAKNARHLQVLHQSSENERLMDLGLMAAGLAHEFKNPLGSIHGSAQILSTQLKDNPQGLEFSRVILDEAQRMNKLVHQILQFSRTHDSPASLVPVDLNRLIQSTFERVFRTPNHELISNMGTLKSFTSGRPELLDLVFSNLFQNILDASRNETDQIYPVTIYHQIIKDLDGQRWTQIDISDEGKGMPPEVLERIYMPYVTTKTKGSGLGMSLVKKALDSHGAKIHVTSQQGKGTKYSLFFSTLDEGEDYVDNSQHPHY